MFRSLKSVGPLLAVCLVAAPSLATQASRSALPTPTPSYSWTISSGPSSPARTAVGANADDQYDDSGTARFVSAGGVQRYGPDAPSAARQFVAESASMLGPAGQLSNLAFVSSQASPAGWRVTWQQTLNGIPVLNHQVVVNLTGSFQPISLENSTVLVTAVSTRAVVTSARAVSIVGGHLIRTPLLAVDASGSAPRLVWRVVSAISQGCVVEANVDAVSGALLRSQNRVEGENIEAFQGNGMVYAGNPVATPQLNVVPFPYLDGSGYFTGVYAQVFRYVGIDPYGIKGVQDVFEPSLRFNYSPGDERLAEAEAYYGISAIHDWFQSTFQFTGRDEPTAAYVHAEGLANADFAPDLGDDGVMLFGYANGIDFALDSDVIDHEYTHAVISKANPDFFSGYTQPEAGGLNEGLADYFSCTHQDDAYLGEYAGAAYGLPFVRSMLTHGHYPQDVTMQQTLGDGRTYDTFPEVHRLGEIWAPACWDLRTVLGADVSDKVLFRAMTLFSQNTRLQQAVSFVLAADRQLYNGVHQPAIRQVFAARGLTTAPGRVDFLTADSFTGAGSQIRTGYMQTDGLGVFHDGDPTAFQPYGLFPSWVAGRPYALTGYSRDTGIKSVFLVVTDIRNRVLGYFGTDTHIQKSVLADGTSAGLPAFTLTYKFPTSFLPGGQAVSEDMRVSIRSYRQPAAQVSARFAGTAASATAGGFHCQVVRDVQSG